MELNVERIWKTAKEDRGFLFRMPFEGQGYYKMFMDALPALLRELLEEGADMETVLSSRIILLQHAIGTEFPRHLTGLYPGQMQLGALVARQEMEKRIHDDFMECLQIHPDPNGYRARNGYASEDAFFCRHPKFTLNRDALVEYRACTLTIGRLLELQPALLLKF